MKKNYVPEIKTGIWIDQENAYIIRLEGNKEPVIQKIRSAVESRVRVKGEKKVFPRFGNDVVDDQEKKQRRQINERKRFFEEIIKLVRNDDYLFVFGPGMGKEELNNAIEKINDRKVKVIAIKAADRLTRNQMVERTIRYFHSDEFINAKNELEYPFSVPEL